MAHTAVIFCLLLAVVVAAGKKKGPSAIGGRIVGGSEIDISKAPHQVSVYYKDEHVCGGSIITHKYVLTAAHCVLWGTKSNYKIRSGFTNHANGGVFSEVRKINRHPEYKPLSLDYDIAIVELNQPLTIDNKNTKVIPLANKEPKDGEEVFVSGWGALQEDGKYPNSLRSVTVRVIKRETCQDNYKKLRYNITTNMFCAGVPEGGKGACKTDSGGAAVVKGRQAGIVSWSIGCGKKDIPGVFTNVAKFREWIQTTVRGKL